MVEEKIETTMDEVKCLFLHRQHLTGRNQVTDFEEEVTTVIRDTGYIQWDPITIVAPSHLISLWSRIGHFSTNQLNDYIWNKKSAFLHWVPTAWIVLMEDYPLYHTLMEEYPDSLGKAWRSHIEPARKYLEEHVPLQEEVLSRLNNVTAGLDRFKDIGKREKSTDGWSSGNEVSTLLHHLHMKGKVMVSGYNGNLKKWTLTENYLPECADRTILSQRELEKQTALRALKALGVASELEINRYFIRGRYWDLQGALDELTDESRILKVSITGEKKAKTQYVRSEDLKLLKNPETSDGELKLIAPFDNLISGRERARRLFNFDYSLEQFLPKERRKFGTYVLPLLWRNDLVGRVDLSLDKKKGILNAISVHAEPGFEEETEIPVALMNTLENFSRFIGAHKLHFGNVISPAWRRILSH